jgi:hypothetical protein
MGMSKPSLFSIIQSRNIPFASHCSDLYVPVTKETTKILKDHPMGINATTFTNQVEGGLWYDVPFAYDPFWGLKAS